ncbi:MAG: hypothetical protein RQ715_09900 [Methylococcales bacterium]|nr:hypothetical protein [Methylococcales bacterium]
MYKKLIYWMILLLSLSSVAFAEAEFDFEELMEAVEDNTYELQATIVAEDIDASLALAQKLDSDFKKVQGYFADWGDAQDAVLDAQRYQQALTEIVALLQQRDFKTATTKAVEFADRCDQACHDTYKPL